MSISSRQHNAIAIIIFCALLVFFRLNSAPLQPFETMLAFKADLIVQFNGFFDLTPYYTNEIASQFAMPPMGIWLTSISLKYLGNLPLHLRIPSVLCSAVCLILIFQIARRIVSYQFALIAPVLLASTLTWNSSARQAGGDIPAVMFILLILWCLIKLGEEPHRISNKFQQRFSKFGIVVLYSFSIAGSFLSGFLAGLIAVMVLFPMIKYLKIKMVLICCAGVVIGIFVAGLWYNHVYLNTLNIFSNGFSFNTIFTLVLSSVLAQPFILIAVITPFLLVFSHYKIITIQKYFPLEMAVLTWFLLSLILGGIFFSEVFLESSVVVLVAPAAIIIALRGYEMLGSSSKQSKLMWIIIIGTISAVISSFNFDTVQSLIHVNELSIGSSIPFLVVMLLIIIGVVIPNNFMHKITSRLTFWFIILLPILLLARIAVINISKPEKINVPKLETRSNYLEKSDGKYQL